MANSSRHSRRRRCALRWRRLFVEQFEPRQLLSSAPTGADKTITGLEDTPYVFAVGDFGFADSGDTPPNNFVAIRIAALPAVGVLADNGESVAAGQLIPTAEVAAGKLTYTPAANANGTAYAKLQFQVQDDGSVANGGANLDLTANTITINVTPVNDPPVGTSSSVTTKEDQNYIFQTADFGFSDPNDSPANAFMDLKIVTLPIHGQLYSDGNAVAAGSSIAAATIAASQLMFVPAPNWNGTPLTSFRFQVQDNGGVSNGGLDTDTMPKIATINVTPVDDPPNGSDMTVTAVEDVSYTFNASDFGFVSLNDPPSHLKAVMVFSLPVTGQLTNNGVSVTWGQFIPVADINAGSFRFIPFANVNGFTTFTFRVQDDAGTANGGIDLDPTPNTITIFVTSVNDAPSGNDRTVTLGACPSVSSYTLSAVDFGFSDPLDSPPNGLAAVKITTVPASGVLANNGVPVTAGQLITTSDLNGGRLVFTPPANFAQSISFTFQVQDNGGTANGGVNLDQTPNFLNFVPASPPMFPVSGLDRTVFSLEDTPYVFTAADFPLDIEGPTLTAVKITTLPAAGALRLNGTNIAVGQFIAPADLATGKLTYTPPANANGNSLASFTFQVQTDGGNCGTNGLDPTPNTVTINVTPVNDAPSGTSNTVTTLANTSYTFPVADFGFTDPNDSPPNSLLAVKISQLPLRGALVLFNGTSEVTVTPSQFISAVNILNGNFRYVGLPGQLGTPYTTFTFQVQDNGGTANGGADLDPVPKRMTINVQETEVITNDDSYGTSEDTALTVQAPGVLSNDLLYYVGGAPAPYPFAAIKVSDPPHGSLMLQSDGSFTYLPAANFSGQDSFTYKARSFVDGNVATATINVLPVNDSPSGAYKVFPVNLGAFQYRLSVLDFGFSDSIDTPSNSLLAVKIVTLPAIASLQVSGVPVTAGQFVPASVIAAGGFQFSFVAPPGPHIPPFVSFLFQVQDNGGTANGGIDLDPTPKPLVIDMTFLPTEGIDSTITLLEDHIYAFSAGDFLTPPGLPGYPPVRTLAAVKIASLPTAGLLTDKNLPVAVGQLIPAADIASGDFQFTSAANANGAPYAQFTFQVQDQDAATDQSLLDLFPHTLTLNVTPVNDPPGFAITDVATTDESGPQAISGWAQNITAGPTDESTQKLEFLVLSNANPSIFTIPPTIGADGKLTFVPRPNTAGSAQILVALRDDGGTANGGIDQSAAAAFTITVTKPHPWHNAVIGLDVTGPGGQPDGLIVPADALAIINYINAFGAGPIPANAANGPPFYDTIGGSNGGGDNFVVASDALAVINYINRYGASLGGEGEATTEFDLALADTSNVQPVATAAEQPQLASVIDLLALDLATQQKRRRLS